MYSHTKLPLSTIPALNCIKSYKKDEIIRTQSKNTKIQKNETKINTFIVREARGKGKQTESTRENVLAKYIKRRKQNCHIRANSDL